MIPDKPCRVRVVFDDDPDNRTCDVPRETMDLVQVPVVGDHVAWQGRFAIRVVARIFLPQPQHDYALAMIVLKAGVDA